MKWLLTLLVVTITGWLLSKALECGSLASERIKPIHASEAQLLESATDADLSNR